MKLTSHSLTLFVLAFAMTPIACGSTAKDDAGGSDDSSDAATPATGPCGIGEPTAYAGDENCLLPPAENEGLQIHVGPTDYTDPDQIWIVPPGGEPTQNYHTYSANTEVRYFFDQKYRMRTGSHHMIIAVSEDTTSPEGWNDSNQNIVATIGGTQHISEDFPPNGVTADEDKGLGRELQPHTPLDIQLHFFNVTSKPILREVWVNFYYKPASEVTDILGYMGGFAPINLPAHTSVTTSGTCDASQAFIPEGQTSERIVTLFGHTHSHTTRFLVKRVKADGSSDVVYDSYDWAEGPTYTYNSLVTNPTPDADTKTTGGWSGDLLLAPSDKLVYSCDMTNDTDNPLKFGNEVQTSEMCNLFGNVVGAGFPCFKVK